MESPTKNPDGPFFVRRLEEANNRLIIAAYGLQDDLFPEVPDDQITLYRPSREEDIRRLLSYSVGCMMGRYSLDKEGLIYAHSGNQGFDPSQYTKFPADEDGIVPVTEAPWFDDDAANRFERFVKTVWPAETLDENLAFVAESLGAKKTETPRETIRRYFAGDFYKHHLQTYKNRPIYWLFSSGKQGAFEALVYLHRYNEGTLSRMRTEYVVPLLGKMNGRIGMLADIIATATSTKQRKDAEKEKDKLTKQLAELQSFDERLNHFASQRITLDLDDGVKVNYGKFGDLLADVKKVCGKAEDD
jgi:type II restriction/modification system DNA methylase subunit YeeA